MTGRQNRRNSAPKASRGVSKCLFFKKRKEIKIKLI